MEMGHLNHIESHALLYEPVFALPGSIDDDIDLQKVPQELLELGMNELQLDWVDADRIRKQLPMSLFEEAPFANGFKGRVLCDSNYGVAIMQTDDGWTNTPFTMDWLPRRAKVLGPAIDAYVRNPSLILSDGVQACELVKSVLDARSVALDTDLAEPPEIIIESFNDLVEWHDELQRALVGVPSGAKVWYRGQANEYQMPDRTRAMQRGYLPHSNIRDPSLVPSLYRNAAAFRNGREEYAKFINEVFVWHAAAEELLGPDFTEVDLGEPFSGHDLGAGLEFSTHHEYKDADGKLIGGKTRHYHKGFSFWQSGLLLQHYGCPSPFLDVTSSIEIAHWFATNKFTPSEGRNFEMFEWEEGRTASSYPVIYAFILSPHLHPFVESRILNDKRPSLRAERQECGLLGGGGVLAKNYASRFLSLKFRLAPSVTADSRFDEEYLFPKSGEDEVYRALRDNKRLAKNTNFPLYGLN